MCLSLEPQEISHTYKSFFNIGQWLVAAYYSKSFTGG